MKAGWIRYVPVMLMLALLCLAAGDLWGQEAATESPGMPGMPGVAEVASPGTGQPPAEVTAAVEEAAAAVSQELFTVNNLWMMIATALVFIMHLGFATLETGLTRAKNTVNVLFKNTIIPGIGLLTYGLCGFAIMYPGEFNGYFGYAGWGITIDASNAEAVTANLTSAYGDGGYTWYTDFLFQGMFAATAATIVSGAVAERIKLNSFLVFSVFFVSLSYPITGSWKWGGGWLDEAGFIDFAGSTLVHAVGGVGALVGAIILGPRLGKYARDGAVQPIPGHSMPLAVIGVFLLWLGWFGFNGGSVLNADPAGVSLVLVTTSMAAAAGAVGASLTSWTIGGKPDLSMALNGILAGLVGITAGADLMTVQDAVIIGFIAGILVYFSVIFLDKLRIDDPVGAVSVHLVCGIWGTLAVGLLGSAKGFEQLGKQVLGAVSVCAFTAVFATVLFLVIKVTMGLRVSSEEEIEGLDLGEHDMAAYPDFQQTYIKSYHAREI